MRLGLAMMLAMFRLPVIAWHLGRAGALGRIAITLLPAWMRHLCASLDRMVRSGNARRRRRRACRDPSGAGFHQIRAGAVDARRPHRRNGACAEPASGPPSRLGALARRRIEQNPNGRIEVFRRFDDEAVAAASIAQVRTPNWPTGWWRSSCCRPASNGACSPTPPCSIHWPAFWNGWRRTCSG